MNASRPLAILLAPLFCVLLQACASRPAYGPSDDQALEPVRQAHQTCLQQQTVALINGSDDVRLLTDHIVGACDDQLQPAATYLSGRGFNSYYIQRFIEEKRAHATRVTADFILRVKSRQNGASPPSSSPAF